jgi:hypothetical protein
MRVKVGLAAFCTAALALQSQRAVGDSLCGQTYTNISDLQMVLRAKPDTLIFDRDRKIATLFESDRRTLWWFAKPDMAAYPTVACMREVPRNGGYVRLPVQWSCLGALPSACQSVVKRLMRVVF